MELVAMEVMVQFGGGGVNRDGVKAVKDCKMPNGGKGEDCGIINILNNIKVYAYGGAGAEGAKSTGGNGAGSGGYPGAGIGGGGAGGAGSTCCSGAGGYSGGGGPRMYGGQNGFEGGGYCRDGIDNDSQPYSWGSGGGYYGGPLGKADNYSGTCQVYLGGMSATGYWDGHQPGNGGVAGKGGKITVSTNAKVYAFNGNRYTDGTLYDEGKNEAIIYYQNGINIQRGYTIGRTGEYGDLTKVTFCETNAQSIVNKTGYENVFWAEKNINSKITINDILNDVDLKYQGIGSGAGYMELSNGTFSIDENLN